MEPGVGHDDGPVLLCPANVSEGRRREIVAEIAAAGEAAGARLLDTHSDGDHNRSVLTFAGHPGPLVEGLVAASRAAADAIDLRSHTGVHPRMGAMDVVPFVPLDPADMPAAVAAAHEFARRLWNQAGMPSFLYEDAAAAAGRTLPEVRRRSFRDLGPDQGGPGPHPTAGATAVGARGLLVAYNVDLATADVSVARRIAAAIRERDGGLAHVRALGLLLAVRGVAQVSMNLTRPAMTGIGAAFAAVAKLAAEEDVEVAASEIVGLAPRVAVPADVAHLLLREPAKILEDEIARVFGAS